MKKLLLLIPCLFLFSCATTYLDPGMLPGENKTTIFCTYSFSHESIETMIGMSEIEHLSQVIPSVRLNLDRSKNIAGRFVKPGKYYYSQASAMNIIFLLNDPRIVLNIKENAINYIGHFDLKYIRNEMIYKLNINTTSDVNYIDAQEEFKKTYPELASLYDFNNALEENNEKIRLYVEVALNTILQYLT